MSNTTFLGLPYLKTKIPPDLYNKKEIIDTIEHNYKNLAETHNNNLYLSYFINEFYTLVTKSLKTDNADLSEELFEKTKLFDTIRNENWRQTFPELAEILDE